MEKISEKELKEIKKELDNIKSVAMMKWPLFASLLRKCRIIADPGVESAGVNIKNEIRINPVFLKRLNDKAKIFTYGHEVGHIAFCYFQREGDKIHWIFNWAHDSVINYLLFAHGFEDVRYPFDLVTPEKIAKLVKKDEKEIAKMSAEGQYHLLEKHFGKDEKPPLNIMNDILKNGKNQDGGDNKDRGKIIQEGDPQAYKPDMTQKDKEKYWRDSLVRAAIQAKIAGRLPADAELLINDLLKAKVDWTKVIKKEILNGLGKNVISTWKKTSRKHPLLPGMKYLTEPNVFLLIDTSASTHEMIPQFLGEVYGILKNQGKGVIYPWDAQAYPPIQLKKAIDLGWAIKEKKIRGGGGTVIAPVLKASLESMKYGDMVVVITDGEIYDLGEKTTRELLQKVAQKSSQAIFGSMNVNVTIPLRWRKVKIEA